MKPLTYNNLLRKTIGPYYSKSTQIGLNSYTSDTYFLFNAVLDDRFSKTRNNLQRSIRGGPSCVQSTVRAVIDAVEKKLTGIK